MKTEIEPVDLGALKDAFERLGARPVAWNGGKPLRDTLLDLYKTEIAPGLEAAVIYTFWVKHAICTDQGCRREVPLFKDYLIAHRTVKVPYWRDVRCPLCAQHFDWEIEPATLVAEKALMINAARGSGGEGRPTSPWTYAVEPDKPKNRRDVAATDLECPCCKRTVRIAVPSDRKKDKKKVLLSVLLCPNCETVWQWRGPLPEGPVECPTCANKFDPRKGNVPGKGEFQCLCGNRDYVIESLRQLPKDKRLPMRPYAMQAHWTLREIGGADAIGDGVQTSLFGAGHDRQESLPLRRSQMDGLLVPPNRRLFKRFSVSDKARLTQAEQAWGANRSQLPHPASDIPRGDETARLHEHHYRYWHEMFASRQLLGLASLLHGIEREEDQTLKELLLCAFSMTLNTTNLFCRYHGFSYREGKIEGVFARHDFQLKTTACESNCFGIEQGYGSFLQNVEKLIEGKADRVPGEGAILLAQDSSSADAGQVDAVVTDPPYVGNVNYSELSDFFYVWQRLLLKNLYPWFSPEYSEKQAEIIENRSRGKQRSDFFKDLAAVFSKAKGNLPENGLMIFTFHHADHEGTVWESLLETICACGFEIAAVYPVHAESESSLHLQDKENISYDLIHVCRKRGDDPSPRSWAGIRQEVRRKARAELAEIEKGRYGGKPLAEPDVRLVCIGKCLELYSAHYGHVMDHEGKPLPLHRALQDISAIVDQLVTKERPLPPELENIDSLSYVWLRCLMPRRSELGVDSLSKELRALQVSIDDVKDAGLVIKGRTGRGRAYEVKQPQERLEAALENLAAAAAKQTQAKLFGDSRLPEGLMMADLWQALIAQAAAGESVLELLERFRPQWAGDRRGIALLPRGAQRLGAADRPRPAGDGRGAAFRAARAGLMAGYLLIEKRMLKPHKADGIAPNEEEIGFLDYLRELNQEPFPIKRGRKLKVVGFEETLLAAAERHELAADIHRRLAARANELERASGFVQVVFEWPLAFGDDLWFTRGAGEKVLLRPVFGKVRREQEGSNVYFVAGFNLT